MSVVKEKPVPAIFCDFDGTVCMQDIGDELFRRFGEFEPHHSRLVNDEITVFEYWKTVCSTLDKSLDKDKLASFLIEFQIDGYFKRFLEFCRKNSIEPVIISDGFDIYIENFLKLNGLEGLNIICNSLNLERGSKAVPRFRYSSESCKCKCALCKRNAMLTNIGENCPVIFIGDGYSDYCAAGYADIIFAKGLLAAHCNKYKIPHYPFNSFFDILLILEGKIFKNKIKLRNQARLMRKKAFETE